MDKVKLLDGRITLIRGDCLEIMPRMKVGIIDLILCDLPYGTTACKWDSVLPLDTLWKEYKRLNRGGTILTAVQPFSTTLIASNIQNYKYSWYWLKNKGTNFQNAKKQPIRIVEDILVFECKTYNPQSLIRVDRIMRNSKTTGGGIVRGDMESSAGKGNMRTAGSTYIQEFSNYPNNLLKFDLDKNTKHPTQKPVALMEYLIKTYTNENDIVLDNTMGSGTTAVACINTNRRFVGMEKDTDDKGNSLGYFDICIQRCEEAIQQLEQKAAA